MNHFILYQLFYAAKICLRIKNTSSGPSLYVLKMIIDVLTTK